MIEIRWSSSVFDVHSDRSLVAHLINLGRNTPPRKKLLVTEYESKDYH